MASFYSNEGDHHILPNEYFLNQKLSSYHFEPESIETAFVVPEQINRHLDFTPNTNHQGLSLSLGSQHPSMLHFHSDFDSVGKNMEYSNPTSTLSDSKYLKAAQDLLEELVSVHRVSTRVKDSDSVSRVEGVSTELQAQELSLSEQDKMTKLVSMLDEVDRRYRQYRYQMQVLSSSFESIAGPGASPPYTSLALRTISRQFRSLRDAIKRQIFSIQTGDPNVSSHGAGVLGCPRYVDNQLRQKNSVHKFGVMRQAWRPQRGLPEKAVSILRAWLFEHFLHPYPKDSEKVVLARETGLTRSQVANWFINARVRLWKPMIEEMYKEEFGSAETKLKSSNDYMTRTDQDMVSSVNQTEFQENFPADKRRREIDSCRGMNYSAHMQTKHNIVHWSGDIMFCDDKSLQETSDEGSGGNQVTLVLGLQRSENDPRPVGGGGIQASGNEYFYMDTSNNNQNRFDSTNLLSDFVV